MGRNEKNGHSSSKFALSCQIIIPKTTSLAGNRAMELNPKELTDIQRNRGLKI